MKNIIRLIGVLGLFFAQEIQAQMTNKGASVFISSGLTVKMTNNLVNSSGTITNNGILSGMAVTNVGTITGTGKLVVGSTFLSEGTYSGNGTLSFEGTNEGAITILGSSEIYNLLVSKSGGTKILNLLSSVKVKNSVTFGAANNKIQLNNHHLELYPLTQFFQHSTTRYFITNGTGLLTRLNMPINSLTIFPVGADALSYNPLDVKNSGTIDNIGVRCLPNILSAGGSGTNVGIHSVNAAWQVAEAVPGGSNLTIFAQWVASDEHFEFTREKCALRQIVGSNWDFPEHSAATGANPYKKGRASIFSTGYFAVRDNNVNPIVPPTVEDRSFSPEIKISAMPNPFADRFILEKISAPNENSNVFIQNMAGQTISTHHWLAEAETLEVDASDFASGVYYVVVEFEQSGRSVLSIVKQRL
jgi:hypothetical protein